MLMTDLMLSYVQYTVVGTRTRHDLNKVHAVVTFFGASLGLGHRDAHAWDCADPT